MKIPPDSLVDRFGRPVNRLRVSITLRCNHACIFCHREGIPASQVKAELSAGDFGFVAEVASSLGIVGFKLTGGEPLVRDDVVDIVSAISQHVEDVSLVTNASRLREFAQGLAEAGLSRVNVSLHSLREDVFRRITGGGSLSDVLEGIEAAIDAGLKVKLNYLVLSLNAGEFKDIVDYASRIGADLNVIELIPIGTPSDVYRELHAGLSPVEDYLRRQAVKVWRAEFQNRPTYLMPSGIKVYVIKGFGNPYLCARCTRLRMSPDGKLQTCIYRPDLIVDARDAILGRDVEGLKEAFRRATELREPYFKLPEKKSSSPIITSRHA